MTAVRSFQNWADRRRQGLRDLVVEPDGDKVARWRARLAALMDEHDSPALLADFGEPVAQCLICNSADALREAAEVLDFPLVLKTDEAGIGHNSDLGGVIPDLHSGEALQTAYADLTSRLGSRVIVQRML